MSRAGANAGSRTRTGRRAGSGDTRGTVLDAARAEFGAQGFDGSTIRGIAGRAGVDPALVHHYFGTKQALFVEAMRFPVDLQAIVPRVLDGPPDRIGERFIHVALDLWERPEVRPTLLAVLRSAMTDPTAAGMLRQLLAEGPILALASALNRPDAPLRATLAGSQVIGMAMARYVVGVEPLASASREEVARAIGPTLQRYLTGDIG
jgi:AcrR family transcriptional regulator